MAAGRIYKAEEEALEYSDMKKELFVPLLVLQAEGKIVFVQTRNGGKRQMFNTFQAKPFFSKMSI